MACNRRKVGQRDVHLHGTLADERSMNSGVLQTGSLDGETFPDGDIHAEQNERKQHASGQCCCLQRRKSPASKSTIATKPSKIAQNTRCGTGASTLPPAVIVSMTKGPESEDVTKETTTRTMPRKDVIAASGRLEHDEQLQFESCIGDARALFDDLIELYRTEGRHPLEMAG
jgi:hypothetical protein